MDKIAKLLRYATTTDDNVVTSFDDYKVVWKTPSKTIYYLTAENLDVRPPSCWKPVRNLKCSEKTEPSALKSSDDPKTNPVVNAYSKRVNELFVWVVMMAHRYKKRIMVSKGAIIELFSWWFDDRWNPFISKPKKWKSIKKFGRNLPKACGRKTQRRIKGIYADAKDMRVSNRLI